VLDNLERMSGGEIFVPRIPSTTVVDLASAIAPDAELEIVGIRPGEKLHEEMISEDDARRTLMYDDHYVIKPVLAAWQQRGNGPEQNGGKQVADGFAYRSDTNDLWLDVESIKELLESM
jgi:UDP-N-acetylglucosamine 4,6-dehydratase